MKFTDCEKCANTGLPLNETLKIDGKIYCKACLESNFTNRDQLKGRVVEKLHDPTVCAACGQDFGNVVLPQIAKYPTCDDCAAALKNKIMPAWVKIFFAAIIAIVVFSFFWNMRFFIAYRDLHTGIDEFSKGDFTGADKLMKTASEKVPEAEDLKTFSTFFSGVSLLAEDKTGEALKDFNACKDKLPPDFKIDGYINNAKMGIGFDTRDYNLFLSAAKDNLSLDTMNVASRVAVASAYSCLYASTGQDSDRVFAELNIQRAHSMDSTSNEVKIFANMIAYRIKTRDIIKREDFIKKYPNGWTKN